MKEDKKLICPKCKEEVKELTRDHLLPRWILVNLTLLGITRKRQKEIMAGNINRICKECNLFKGGYPDYDNALARKVMAEIASQIKTDIADYNKSLTNHNPQL